ncbi:MAG: alpha/beta hydrolase, partial [Alphaproteobacteria bacterium]|nr:alpha/beta hydrolase [Alphaproteobacteria bacterium]
VAEFIRGVGRPVWIVGHSIGGKIAIEIANKHPDKVLGIVLISASGFVKFKTLMRRYSLRAVAWIFRMLHIRAPKFWDKFRAPDYAAVDPIMKYVMSDGLKFNTAGAARTLHVPTLIIYGKKDTETPAYFGKKFARRIKGSVLRILPEFGHNNILDAGKYQVSGLIKGFIK